MANEVRTFTLNDDPGQVIEDLNAAFDGTTQTGLKAESAVNVTTNINGHAITDILEPDGTTVKKATLAEAAKGDTRFQISGGLGGQTGVSIAAETYLEVQKFIRTLPANQRLVLKRANYFLNTIDNGLRIKIILADAADEEIYWNISSALNSYRGDISFTYPQGVIISSVVSTRDCNILIAIYNSTGTSVIANPTSSWWLDFAIEDA